jgi:uncharacterized protein YcbK (DUF882 family)
MGLFFAYSSSYDIRAEKPRSFVMPKGKAKTPDLKYFKLSEFDCSVSGENDMKPEFLLMLDALRDECGFSFTITSGYRSPTKHPIETAKAKPGTHAQGIAADIATTDAHQRFVIVSNAIKLGFQGVGIARSFIHVDSRTTKPRVWSYS